MPELIISTREGRRHEVEVRDKIEANHEINRFVRELSMNHPGDKIIDASVLAHGNIVARLRNGEVEDF